MSHDSSHLPLHPTGDQPSIEQAAELAPATLSTWAGPVRVEWDPTALLTPYGQLPFFIEFLKVAGLFDALAADCPLAYTKAANRARLADSAMDALKTVQKEIVLPVKPDSGLANMAGTVSQSMSQHIDFSRVKFTGWRAGWNKTANPYVIEVNL